VKQYLTKQEVAEYFGVSIRTITNWIRQGILPAQRVGSRFVRIDLDDLKHVITPIPSSRNFF
jgi:excisionase family DNA binding protein